MAADTQPPGREPIPPQVRRRLQEYYNQGTKMMAKGEYDYANDMFARCVDGDPGNSVYVQNFLANLQRKYNNNKKGSKFAALKSAGPKAAIQKAKMQKDWKGVVRTSLEMLKLNPWDIATLKSVAGACEALEADDSQLAFLKAALDADINDVEVNRLAGRALGRLGRFDDAIRCWARVAKAVKNDDEANRAIGDLTVEKTISKGGYEGAESSRDVRAGGEATDDNPVGLQVTPERQLEKAIAKDPSDVSNYLKLAELYQAKEQFEPAEKWLQKALEASGGDVNIRERLENLQVGRMREQLSIAEKQARERKTPEAIDLFNKMRAELNRVELEMYRSRSERNPTHTGYKYELAIRLHKAGMYKEAIPLLQQSLADPSRQGEVRLILGECFQQIKQYDLAMTNYSAAVEGISAADVERKKLALYRAGVLATGLKDPARAKKYLTELAGLDFGYKDVAARLDKLK